MWILNLERTGERGLEDKHLVHTVEIGELTCKNCSKEAFKVLTKLMLKKIKNNKEQHVNLMELLLMATDIKMY